MATKGKIHAQNTGSRVLWRRGPASHTAPADLVATAVARDTAREEARAHEYLIRELAHHREREALFADLTGKPLPPVERLELGSGLREATAVGLLSDAHAETLVYPWATPNGNTYTLDIADLRLRRFFSSYEWMVQSAASFKIRNAIVWLGGDFITSHLHPENVETAQLGPNSAILWVQERLINGLKQLLYGPCGFERIDVICSEGNHPRTTEKMRASTAVEHNLEWLMYQSIRLAIKDERLNVLATPTMHQYHDVYGFKLHFHHGHEIRYSGGIGGITIPINKAVAAWDRVRTCHYHHFGHYHQYIDTGNVVVNGSLIGYDAFAMSIKAAPEPPQQAFYLLDAKRGKSLRAPLWVGDPENEALIWDSVKERYTR